MTAATVKIAADIARAEATAALTAWEAASRESWARGESCDYLRAADDAAHRAYIAAAELGSIMRKMGWTSKTQSCAER